MHAGGRAFARWAASREALVRHAGSATRVATEVGPWLEDRRRHERASMTLPQVIATTNSTTTMIIVAIITVVIIVIIAARPALILHTSSERMGRVGPCSCSPAAALSRRGRSSPANAGGCDTHRDSLTIRLGAPGLCRVPGCGEGGGPGLMRHLDLFSCPDDQWCHRRGAIMVTATPRRAALD
eukprot:COSAG01_NODE_2506_length_7552_cov_66.389776_5_plen_183_part_00